MSSWRIRRLSLAPAAMLVRASAATLVAAVVLHTVVLAAPKFTSTWKAPEAARTSFAGTKVAALVISGDENLRMSAEEALARELAAIGMKDVVAAYRLIPREELQDATKARGGSSGPASKAS